MINLGAIRANVEKGFKLIYVLLFQYVREEKLVRREN